jgi:hypothetical protein
MQRRARESARTGNVGRGDSSPSRSRRIAIAALFICLAAPLSADDAVEPSTPPTGADAATSPGAAADEEYELLENLQRDLTVIRSRTDLLSEFTDLDGSGWSEKLTLGSTWGFHLPGLGPEHEGGVRLQVPMVIEDPGPDSTEVGLGDVELKAGWVFIPDEENRLGLFGNLKFNTATDDILGDNRDDFSVGGAASHQVIEDRFSIFVVAEYLGTFTKEDDISSRSALELSFNPILRIAGPLAANFLMKDKLDFRADDHFFLVEPGLSMLLVERHLGVATSLEIPLDDDSYNYIAKVGMVWFY